MIFRVVKNSTLTLSEGSGWPAIYANIKYIVIDHGLIL